jgi:hypothetical protein
MRPLDFIDVCYRTRVYAHDDKLAAHIEAFQHMQAAATRLNDGHIGAALVSRQLSQRATRARRVKQRLC